MPASSAGVSHVFRAARRLPAAHGGDSDPAHDPAAARSNDVKAGGQGDRDPNLVHLSALLLESFAADSERSRGSGVGAATRSAALPNGLADDSRDFR